MANVQKMIDIIVLNGTMPMQEKYPYESLTKENGWEDCPVPQMMGIPLMAKPIRPYSGQIPDQQFAVFMMIEPESGFAPARWQLGPHCIRGMIGFALKDGKPFTIKAWGDLHSYIYDLMDCYSDGMDSEKIIKKKINPAAYNKYLSTC